MYPVKGLQGQLNVRAIMLYGDGYGNCLRLLISYASATLCVDRTVQ